MHVSLAGLPLGLARQTHVDVHVYGPSYYVLMHTVNSFVELGKKLLSTDGVKAVFSERSNEDPLESFFGKQRQHGGYRENPTVQDFIHGTQSLRVQGALARDPLRGNTRKADTSIVIDDTPLPKRKRCSSSKT